MRPLNFKIMYYLSTRQREALKGLKSKKQENERKIAALQRQNDLIDIDIAETIAAKPVKADSITPIANLLSIYFKPGKVNVDRFLNAAEVLTYLFEVAPKESQKLTARQIGQGLTRLTKASSTVAKSTFGIKRGYWLKKVNN